MAKSFMHPIWDALLSFRSIDLEEFFTMYLLFPYSSGRKEGKKEEKRKYKEGIKS